MSLKVKDIHERRGVKHFRIHGKGGKLRYVPAYAGTLELISDYLEAAGHAGDQDGALFRPIQNNVTGRLNVAMRAHAVYAHVVRHYGKKIGLDGARLGPHALRATAAKRSLSLAKELARVVPCRLNLLGRPARIDAREVTGVLATNISASPTHSS